MAEYIPATWVSHPVTEVDFNDKKVAANSGERPIAGRQAYDQMIAAIANNRAIGIVSGGGFAGYERDVDEILTNNIQLQVVLYCQPAKRAILAAEQSLLLAELLLQNAENDFTITRRMPLLERRDVVSAILTPPR